MTLGPQLEISFLFSGDSTETLEPSVEPIVPQGAPNPEIEHNPEMGLNSEPPNQVQDETMQLPLENEGKKSHVCNKCGKAFACIFELNKHALDIHFHKKNELYKCTLCRYKCRQRYILEKHIKKVHEGNKQFACSLCNSKFEQKARLHRHIKEGHEKKYFYGGKKPAKAAHKQ